MNKNNLIIVVVLLILAIVFVYNKKTNDVKAKEEQQNSWQDKNWNDPQTKVEPKRDQIVPKPAEPEAPIKQKADNYQEALELSKKSNKPILLFFTATWCGYCVQMKNNTIPNADVQKMLKNFVYCEIDVDKDKATATKYGVRSMPTYKIINSGESVLGSSQGYQKPAAFNSWLNNYVK